MVILEQRVTRAAAWSRRLASFSLVFLLTACLAHGFQLLETLAFISVLVTAGMIAAFALGMAFYAFSRVWYFGDLGGWDLTVGGLVACLVLAPFGLAGYRAVTYPELTDISTDLDGPPKMPEAARARSRLMNSIADPTPEQKKLQSEGYPTVTGRRYDLPFERTADVLDTVLAQQGWIVSKPQEGDGELTVEALAYTQVLAFPVDVAVRLTDEGASTYVDMRSSSRFGRHDLGDNAARIIDFLAQLDSAVAEQAGTLPAE